MAVTPPVAGFFGLDPRFMAGPGASSSLINPLLFGASNQMVPINHGGFNSGIPPIFGGGAFGGLQTVPFNIFAQPARLQSPQLSADTFFGTRPSNLFPFMHIQVPAPPKPAPSYSPSPGYFPFSLRFLF